MNTPNPPSVMTADDAMLMALISTAEERIVMVTPGMSLDVARQLDHTWRSLPDPSRVTVVVDVEADVMRMGYGELDAVVLLEETARDLGQMLAKQKGVRIGVLIVDDRTLIWAPTPQLIEAPPEAGLEGARAAREPQAGLRPNAVFLDSVPEVITRDLGLSWAGVQEQVIGLDKADRGQIKAVEEDLKRLPPQRFDIARAVRVFDARIQFVELELNHVRVDRRTVALPPELMGLGDPETLERLSATFRLIDDPELSPEPLIARRREIEEKYLRRLRGYGWVVRLEDKSTLEKEVATLTEQVKTFDARVRQTLKARSLQAVEKLIAQARPALLRNPPKLWISDLYGVRPGGDQIVALARERIMDAFNEVVDGWKPMSVRLTFKGVTYEMLNDPAFHDEAQKRMPDLGSLFSQFDAAPATPDTAQNTGSTP